MSNFYLTPTYPPSSPELSLFSDCSVLQSASTMTTSSISTSSSLNCLIQQRKDITASRDKQAFNRVAKQVAGDKIFENVQIFKVARFEAAEALRLAREQANQEALLVLIKERHERELSKLHRKHEKEVRGHERDTEKMLNDIKEDTDVLVGELLWNLDAEARNRSLERKKEEKEIQGKRVREDDFYKDLVFRAVEAEARQPIRAPSTNLPAHILVSNNKRAHSDYASTAPLKAHTTSSDAIPTVIRSSKRRKSNGSPQLAESEASTSPSATLSAQGLTDLAGGSSISAYLFPNQPTDNSIQTCFELNYISDGLSGDPEAITWKAFPDQPRRSLRANFIDKVFEPYDAGFCESAQQPTWVLDAVGARVVFDRGSARMQVRYMRDSLKKNIFRCMEIELKDLKEFDAFIVIFMHYYEGTLAAIHKCQFFRGRSTWWYENEIYKAQR